MATTVPKKYGPPCPMENGKLKIGTGPCSIALGCESIECECLEGVGASVKYNWKKHETTVGLLGGYKESIGIGTQKFYEVGFKAGLTMTFNKDGAVTDIGAVAKANATMYVGSVNMSATSGVSAGVSVAAVTSIKTEVGVQLAYKH